MDPVNDIPPGIYRGAVSDTELLCRVLRTFGIPDEVTAAERVGRAWSNRVWSVWTPQRHLAIKELLNPWNDPLWREWLSESIAFERKAIAAGVRAPAVILDADGEALVDVDERTFRAHDWVDGAWPCPSGPARIDIAVNAARDLATMHALAVEPARRDVFPTATTATCDGWARLVDELRSAGSPYVQAADALAQDVARVADWFGRRGRLADASVMSHGDIDQKNLLLADGDSWLVDWDVAAPWIPAEEALRTALSLADWRDASVAHEFLASYTSASGLALELSPELVSVDLLISIDWLDRCLRIASGLHSAEGYRVAEAQQQAEAELARLPERIRISANLPAWFSSEEQA